MDIIYNKMRYEYDKRLIFACPADSWGGGGGGGAELVGSLAYYV